jgi:general secretion pathway protein H
MLVVLALVALVTSVISISTRPDPRQGLRREAERVGLLLGLAGDEARMSGRRLAWFADLSGYRFAPVGPAPDAVPEASGSGNIDEMLRPRDWESPLTALRITDLASGRSQQLDSAGGTALHMEAGREWIAPRWRLELVRGEDRVDLQFGADGHAHAMP